MSVADTPTTVLPPTASSSGRPAIRARIFKAIAERDFELAVLIGQRLSRLQPKHADDLTVAAVAWICQGNFNQARPLLEEALRLDPHQNMAAKAMARLDTALPAPALAALRWHAETDPDAVKTLITHVGATGEPQAYVAARMVYCILPPGTWEVGLHWRHLMLADIRLTASDQVRQVCLTMPDALRGVINPVVRVNGVDLPQGPFPATLLAAPRLSALVRADDPGRWQIQAFDKAAPGRPVALSLRDGYKQISRHTIGPVTGSVASSHEDIPALSITPPENASHAALYFELTGEPVTMPATAWPDDGIVDVIIPVHGDHAATKACFEALLEHDPGTPMRIIAIDDASPDPSISGLLDDLAGRRRIALVRNPGNLGFVRSVNIGMAAHGGRDVVLLNADTVVAAGWLARLRKAARAGADTGTVTPWSNDATICSYPAANSPTPLPDVDVATLDRLVAGTLAGRTAAIPTAVGFCMYIRRDCLRQTGWFDADAFGTGYGEENDFCLRATARGWRHLIALDVFVGHVGGGSFGAAKQARIEAALAVLESRHPGYGADIRTFIDADPLRAARRQLDLAQLRAAGGARPLLILCARLGGGTDRFIGQRIDRQPGGERDALILRPEKPEGDGSCRFQVEVPDRPDLTNLIYDAPTELDLLRADLTELGVTEMELHHTVRLPPALLPVLTSWFPYSAHIHDYGWICPRYNLIGGTGRYCGEPDVAECERCVATHGDLMEVGMGVGAWRQLTRTVLASARAVGCSCQGTADRMRRYVPEALFQVAPAEPPPPPSPVPPRQTDGPLRVVVPGAIGPNKGYDILLACAADATRRKLPLLFLLLGYSMEDDALIATGHVEVTGRYEEEEVPELLAQLRPHAAFLPSVWPETWCYALTHVLAAGLFTATFDLGAQAERLRARGNGLLLPVTLAAEAINDTLLARCPRA